MVRETVNIIKKQSRLCVPEDSPQGHSSRLSKGSATAWHFLSLPAPLRRGHTMPREGMGLVGRSPGNYVGWARQPSVSEWDKEREWDPGLVYLAGATVYNSFLVPVLREMFIVTCILPQDCHYGKQIVICIMAQSFQNLSKLWLDFKEKKAWHLKTLHLGIKVSFGYHFGRRNIVCKQGRHILLDMSIWGILYVLSIFVNTVYN